MQCCLDTAVLVVLSILFLNPASLVTAFGHHLMPSNGLAKLVIRALKRYYLLFKITPNHTYIHHLWGLYESTLYDNLVCV